MGHLLQNSTRRKLFKLGLIGDNIAESKSPDLHLAAGALCGVEVSYELLVPPKMGKSFKEVFDAAKASRFRGINITYPYKEQCTSLVLAQDLLVKAIGAINTVVFDDNGPRGYNTDYTGFLDAYQAHRGKTAPGIVCLIGTGGVGRAVAFALNTLGASVIRCVDLDETKSNALVSALKNFGSNAIIESHTNATTAADGADGIINCTPIGMKGLEGSALCIEAMSDGKWAFDAVYTPINTKFLTEAKAIGLSTFSGFELFLGQGIGAWQFFTGMSVDKVQLREFLCGDAQ